MAACTSGCIRKECSLNCRGGPNSSGLSSKCQGSRICMQAASERSSACLWNMWLSEQAQRQMCASFLGSRSLHYCPLQPTQFQAASAGGGTSMLEGLIVALHAIGCHGQQGEQLIRADVSVHCHIRAVQANTLTWSRGQTKGSRVLAAPGTLQCSRGPLQKTACCSHQALEGQVRDSDSCCRPCLILEQKGLLVKQ